jgi:hypothetical protein
MGDGHNAKVTKHYRPLIAEQHVVRFDIAMDQLVLMGILQGTSDLLHIREDLREWERLPARMAGAQ